MKFYITTLILFLTLSLTAQGKRYYGVGGNIMESGDYENGKETGEWKYYFDNNILKSEGSYKNGEKNGVWKEYYKSGKLLRVTEYKNGDKNYRKDEEYYENGQLKVSIKYKNGRMHGKVVSYFADGHIESKGKLKNGTPVGKSIRYWENHNLRAISKNKGGIIETLGFYQDGKKLKVDHFNTKTGNGEYTTYYQDGSVKEYSKVENKKLVLHESFYENGKQKQSEIHTYIGDDDNYVATKYDETGSVQKIDSIVKSQLYSSTEYIEDTIVYCMWNKGYKNGPYIARYKDGSIAEKGNYTHSGKTGAWKSFYNNGQLRFEGNFEYDSIRKMGGYRNGEHKYYYPDGTLQNIEHYEITHYESEAYRDGKPKKSVKTGTWYSYYPDGKTALEITYDNNQRNELLKEYYRNGNTAHTANYNKDRLVGLETFFFENSNTEHTIARNDNGYKQGKEIYYHDDGNEKEITNYDDGYKQGAYAEYYDNGQLKTEGNYLSDIKFGNWKYYNDNGNLILEENYEPDSSKYTAINYYSNGQTAAKVTGDLFNKNDRNYMLYAKGKAINLYDSLGVNKEDVTIDDFEIKEMKNDTFSLLIKYTNKKTGVIKSIYSNYPYNLLND